ncbi:MAG: hypothetical protein CM1200mP28_08220 [Deltaproteobacteria bacterium]|nr:MAG: hypothetical protein CM1200mP28_08220 [Deltaproteobacteria bacterium]
MYRKEMVIQDQESSLRRNFEKNHITVFEGSPRFLSPTSIEIHPADETEKYEITTDSQSSPQVLPHAGQNGHLLIMNVFLIQIPSLK